MARTLFLGTLVLFAGCASESYSTAPVSGTVTLDGEPLANASVGFEPIRQGQDIVAGYGSYGETDENGNFTLKTLHGQDGAIVGKHRVSIRTVSGEMGPDGETVMTSEERLPPRYNSDTELTFEVPPEGSDAANFDLNTD